MASCAAVLSATNAPLFVLSDDEDSAASPAKSKESSSSAGSLGGNLADHYSLHQSLDVIEEKIQAAASGASKSHHQGQASRELYLGTLFTTEKKKVFG